jgi:hypothetical protein
MPSHLPEVEDWADSDDDLDNELVPELCHLQKLNLFSP